MTYIIGILVIFTISCFLWIFRVAEKNTKERERRKSLEESIKDGQDTKEDNIKHANDDIEHVRKRLHEYTRPDE